MSRKAIRLPRPDLMTPFATKKAANMSNIKLSENPENAVSGGKTLNMTTATSAIIEAVKIERASSNTPAIAVIKMANKCQASGVISHGMGRCQITTPKINVINLFIQRCFW
jgi:hypothetical protein